LDGLPSAPSTRWHGITIGSGFVSTACATARRLRGWPTIRASFENDGISVSGWHWLASSSSRIGKLTASRLDSDMPPDRSSPVSMASALRSAMSMSSTVSTPLRTSTWLIEAMAISRPSSCRLATFMAFAPIV